ncbi:MAG: sugar transferase [Bryobacteraceae bacterium]|nr:sugar transferase [Bryobacteraceae bacterium]
MTSRLATTTMEVPGIQRLGPLEFPAMALVRARRIKRAMDVVFAVIALVVAAPLFMAIALALVLESGRPILFRQERVGRGNTRFFILKFRSMVADADAVLARYLESDVEAWREWETTRKLRNDPRVTRVGRFLRRTSLDELPQLWNVLRGEMSMAGPRPITETEIRRYGAAFPFYQLIRPGLTGLWQVSGRNDTTYRRRVELDVQYVRRWSPWLDVTLLFRTARVVFVGKGAY